MTNGPVLIELDDTDDIHPHTAEAITDPPPQGAAMQRVVALSAGRRRGLGGWVLAVTLALLGFVLGLAAWDYLTALLDRSPVLGGIATGLLGLLIALLIGLALRELAGFARLRRIDRLQNDARAAINTSDNRAAQKVLDALLRLYQGREDMTWAVQSMHEGKDEALETSATFALAETRLLAPLDARAQSEVEAAARQVATVTALVPIALADVVTALTANLRMIRRIAEIYGGRAGTLGSWRLIRTVMTHLVATGAVAIGDDLIGSIAGGGVMSRVSRRFGEGVINGALTARVGIAAIEVCRPLPFDHAPRPSVGGIVKRSLSGLFSRSDA